MDDAKMENSSSMCVSEISSLNSGDLPPSPPVRVGTVVAEKFVQSAGVARSFGFGEDKVEARKFLGSVEPGRRNGFPRAVAGVKLSLAEG